MANQSYDYNCLAKKLGYLKLKGAQRSHGQAVFNKGRYYISPDHTCHNGGVWKKATSLEDLFSKNSRLGTYDANLKLMKD